MTWTIIWCGLASPSSIAMLIRLLSKRKLQEFLNRQVYSKTNVIDSRSSFSRTPLPILHPPALLYRKRTELFPSLREVHLSVICCDEHYITFVLVCVFRIAFCAVAFTWALSCSCWNEYLLWRDEFHRDIESGLLPQRKNCPNHTNRKGRCMERVLSRVLHTVVVSPILVCSKRLSPLIIMKQLNVYFKKHTLDKKTHIANVRE